MINDNKECAPSAWDNCALSVVVVILCDEIVVLFAGRAVLCFFVILLPLLVSIK